MEGHLGVVIHDGSLEQQHIQGGNTSANGEPAVMESNSGFVIQDGSVLHQYILENSIVDLDDEMDPDDEMEGDSTSEAEDERMPNSSYKGFGNRSDAVTHSQSNSEHNHNAVGGDRTIVANQAQVSSSSDQVQASPSSNVQASPSSNVQASSSSNSMYRSEQIKTVRPKQNTRHGYKQGAARFRSGQRLAANEHLSKQVNVLHAQLGLAKDSAKAELAGEFHQHIANVEAEAQAKENVLLAEWAHLEDRVKQREEAAADEQARAAQLIRDKEAENEALRVASLQRENDMLSRMAALMKSNEELRLLHEQSQRQMDERFEQFKNNALPPTPAANPARDEDLNRIKEFIHQTEATAREARNRATSLEAVVIQKDNEIEAIRVAMMQREAAAKEAMISMQKAQEELRQNQIQAQKETSAEIERLKADKEREVSIALQQKKRSAATTERPMESRSPHSAATNDYCMTGLDEPGPSTQSSFLPAPKGADHHMTGPDEPSSNTPNTHTTSTSSAKELMTRIKNKKELAQRRNIPVLRPAPALENEEDAGDELSADDDDDEEDSPKDKGKGKINLDNFQDMIIGAVRQAIVAYAPEIGISITTPPKQTRVSSQRTAIAAERKTHSQPARTRISKIIRNVIQDAFNITKYDDLFMHEPPSAESIRQFEESGIQCPNPDDLRIDMKGMISSKWNKAVMQILLALVNADLAKEAWLPECSDAFLRDKIQKVIEKGRTLWQQTQARIVEDGTVETMQQMEERIIRERAASDARARAYARRSNKFATRCKIVEYIIARKIAAGGAEEDIALWKWLRLLLETLGKDGMSSEESEVEEGTGRAVYYVKKMPWRKSDATKHVRFIDRQRDTANGMYSRQGNQPVPRITVGDRGGLSRRPAPPGRPRALYEDEWVQKQHPSDIAELQISNEKFAWREFYPLG